MALFGNGIIAGIINGDKFMLEEWALHSVCPGCLLEDNVRTLEKTSCDPRRKDWSDVAASPGLPRIKGHLPKPERKGRILLSTLQEHGPTDTSVLDLLPPEL